MTNPSKRLFEGNETNINDFDISFYNDLISGFSMDLKYNYKLN